MSLLVWLCHCSSNDALNREQSGVLVIFGFSVLNRKTKKPKNQIGNLVFPFFCFQKNQKTEFGNLVFPFFCFKHKIKKTEFQKNQVSLVFSFFYFSVLNRKSKKPKNQIGNLVFLFF